MRTKLNMHSSSCGGKLGVKSRTASELWMGLRSTAAVCCCKRGQPSTAIYRGVAIDRGVGA